MGYSSSRKANAVFERALAKIKPSESENQRCLQSANGLIGRLQKAVPSNVEIKLAGSLAKGTYLKGNNEFDIFLLFPRHYPHHEMTLLGLSYARKAFAGMRMESRYAEHPYLQVFHGIYHADVVPAYRINSISEKGSSVDRSQLHTQYVNSHLDASGKDGVRLLKRFMKNFGIYGAELRVEGFSGYLCELLVIRYGSLLHLMEEAAGWDEPAIDGEKHFPDQSELKKKFSSPLIVVDPVDPGRNVAAVVAQTSLSRFIFECRRFLRSPSIKFFFSEKRQHSLAEVGQRMAERKTSCLLASFAAPKAVPDVLWPQLKKTAHALSRRLSEQGLSVFGCYHWSDGVECVVFLELDRWDMPAIVKAEGPSIKYASDAEAFVRKHKGALNLHLEHDRIVAVEKRQVTTASAALQEACHQPHGLGIPHNMEQALFGAKVLEGRGALKGKYREFLADYFFAKIA